MPSQVSECRTASTPGASTFGAGSTSVALLSHDDAARTRPLAIEVPDGRALTQSSAGSQPRRPHRERASRFGYPGRSDERFRVCEQVVRMV